MKRIAYAIACTALLLGMSGCALLDNLVPSVTVPFNIGDFTLSDIPGGHQFLEKAIDLSDSETWNEYKDRIRTYETISLSSTVTQTAPVSATVKLYVSDTAGIAEQNLDTQAEKIAEATLGTNSPFTLNTTPCPISADIREIVDDGVFNLYAVGSASGTLTAEFKLNKVNLVVKPGFGS